MPRRRKEINPNGSPASHPTLARFLTGAGREFYGRGWVLGTSGNFSAVASSAPLRLAITASGADKGALTPGQILQIDERGEVTRGRGRPSDEARLHLTVVRVRGAGAVLHTHSVWSTMLSDVHAARAPGARSLQERGGQSADPSASSASITVLSEGSLVGEGVVAWGTRV